MMWHHGFVIIVNMKNCDFLGKYINIILFKLKYI
jgi:hypothetical protein